MTDMNLLSDTWLRRAQQLNPYYRERLKWPVPAGWPSDVASVEFALRVAAFQKEHGALTVDGILGPKTAEAIKGSTFTPLAGNFLVAGGERIPVPFPVVTWDEPNGISFYGHGGWSKRRDPSGKGVNLFVLHWDGCTSARQCFHVLLERGLSVHLMLDGDGSVYQALDLAEARAWHAGDVNERSIGVEIQNPVQLHRNQWQKPPREVVLDPGVHGGPTYEHLDFYDVQMKRVVELAEVLCARFGIPRTLPLGAGGDVLRTLAPTDFRGVCGHYHVSRSKPDPGLTLWPGLQASFREPPPTYPTARREAVA
jgi:hypothetical protein